MNPQKDAVTFTPTHHALLFAWIAREVVQRFGERDGQAAIRKAVRHYGEQRGSRMAQRAQSDGNPLDMTTYLAYGEWQAAPESFETQMEAIKGSARSRVLHCPWHQAWVGDDINEYGRLYCLDIDESLGRGFNPDQRLQVNATRSNGAAACEFIYHGADLEALKTIQVDRNQTVMPWDYHLGHLYQAMHAVLGAALGPEGVTAAEAGLAVFEQRFGAAAAEIIRAHLDDDFRSLPGPGSPEDR